jgi:hypothetical protein
MIKRGILLLSLIFILLGFFSGLVSASLGISPAGANADFVPGAEYNFKFEVIVDDPDKELIITLGGDLAQYATLDKEELVGGGIVNVNLKLPDEISTPGFHEVGLSVKEKIPEESFLGTTINIMANIKVFAPYPGRYLEGRLSVSDGNIDEEIPVELRVFNRGKENIFVNVFIDFLAGGAEQVHRMYFEQAQINTTQDRYFRKFLNTSVFKPGDYVAQAYIDFGEIITVNQSFRVGSLFVNINNFTEKLPRGGIQKYHVGIESRWNDYLKEVFADVNISNKTKEVVFRTPSLDLKSWERAILEGFLDTNDMEGEYVVDIVLNYADQQSKATGTLSIYTIGSRTLLIGIGAGVILLIIIIIIIFIIYRRNRKKKRRK